MARWLNRRRSDLVRARSPTDVVLDVNEERIHVAGEDVDVPDRGDADELKEPRNWVVDSVQEHASLAVQLLRRFDQHVDAAAVHEPQIRQIDDDDSSPLHRGGKSLACAVSACDIQLAAQY